MSRTPKDINWDVVERMMEAGSSGIEISGVFDMHHDTFYSRFQKEYNTSFALASQNKKETGKGRLREAQFRYALKGNTALLIRLGEVHLGQGQKVDIAPNDEKLDDQLADSKLQGELEQYKLDQADYLKWKALQNGAKSQAEPECLPSDQEI